MLDHYGAAYRAYQSRTGMVVPGLGSRRADRDEL